MTVSAANVLLVNVSLSAGVLNATVSIFDSRVIQAICNLLGMNFSRMSAYHPMENGQVHRLQLFLKSPRDIDHTH